MIAFFLDRWNNSSRFLEKWDKDLSWQIIEIRPEFIEIKWSDGAIMEIEPLKLLQFIPNIEFGDNPILKPLHINDQDMAVYFQNLKSWGVEVRKNQNSKKIQPCSYTDPRTTEPCSSYAMDGNVFCPEHLKAPMF